MDPYCENRRDGSRQPAGRAYDLSPVNVVIQAWAKTIILERASTGIVRATGAKLVDGGVFLAEREVITSSSSLRIP